MQMNENNAKKIMNLLSMAQRANKIVSGESSVEKFVQSGRAKFLLVAADASDGTIKKYMDMANFYQVDTRSVLSKEMMGDCIGKGFRAALALEDEGFIKALKKLLDVEQ